MKNRRGVNLNPSPLLPISSRFRVKWWSEEVINFTTQRKINFDLYSNNQFLELELLFSGNVQKSPHTSLVLNYYKVNQTKIQRHLGIFWIISFFNKLDNFYENLQSILRCHIDYVVYIQSYAIKHVTPHFVRN